MNEDLIKKSGEDLIKQRPRYILPIVRFNGKEGRFNKIIFTEEGKEIIDLGEKIEGVMLKIRRSFTAFSKDYRMYTNEHNSWRDKVNLFETRKTLEGIKTELIDTGTIKELKERWPGLKMNQVIYFYLLPKGEIVKLIVKGKGLSYLFDYWAEFKPEEHIYQYITLISSKKEVSDLGPYFAITFARKEMVSDMDLIAEKIYEVASKIEEVESYYPEYVPPEEIPVVEEEPEFQIDEGRVKEFKKKAIGESINTKEIPF